MNTYLAIITTVLVITQVIRVTQNTIQLRWQWKKLDKALSEVSDITEEDLQTQKEAYRLIVEHLKGGGEG